jgi:hypothetical protein
MTIQDWGAVGEIVGAAGVIASLLYLAIQIRQSSRTARNATTQSIMSMSAHMNTAVAGDISPTIAKMIAGAELNPDEEFRYFSFLMAVFASHWQVHYQFEHGMIEAEIFEAYERRTIRTLERPGVLEWWGENSPRFGTSFQEYIDNLIARAA